MNSISLQNFLYSIADDMKRPHELFDPIIKSLEDNWFDSTDSLKTIEDEMYEKMKIPLKLVQMIKNKLKSLEPPKNDDFQDEKILQKNENLQKKEFFEENENLAKNEIFQKNEKNEKSTKKTNEIDNEAMNMINDEQLVYFLVNDLKKACSTQENIRQTLSLFKTIINNIISDPKNPNFRKIKLTNKKFIEIISPYPPALDLLRHVGFEFNAETMFFADSKDLFALKHLIEIIETELIQLGPSFDPYQSFVTGSKQFDATQNLKKQGEESFIDKLEELKKKREQMIKPIKNREIRIYKVDPSKTLQQLQYDLNENACYQMENLDHRDPEIKKAMLEASKNLQAYGKFSSKSKQEFEDMLQKPFYIETKIRVRLPNYTIWEAKFTPNETLQNVFDLFKQYLQIPDLNGYLFQTPPFKKMNQKDLMKTLEQHESVPSGMFFFALEDKKLESEIKEYLRIN